MPHLNITKKNGVDYHHFPYRWSLKPPQKKKKKQGDIHCKLDHTSTVDGWNPKQPPEMFLKPGK